MLICQCGGHIATSTLSGNRQQWVCKACGRAEITGESVRSMHRSSEGSLGVLGDEVATPPYDRTDASTPPLSR